MPDWSNESYCVPSHEECNRGITYPSEAFNFRGLLLDWAGDDGASDNLPGALWKTKKKKESRKLCPTTRNTIMKIKENQRVKRIEKHAIDETRLYGCTLRFWSLLPTLSPEINI